MLFRSFHICFLKRFNLKCKQWNVQNTVDEGLETHPGESPCRCLRLGSSLYSGSPHISLQRSQASSNTASLPSHWPGSGHRSRRAVDRAPLKHREGQVSMIHCLDWFVYNLMCDKCRLGLRQSPNSFNLIFIHI